MDNVQQYQAYQGDDDQSNGLPVSGSVASRAAFESVEEPIKYMVRTGGRGIFDQSMFHGSINVQTPSFGLDGSSFEGFGNVASNLASRAQMEGRAAFNFTVKKSAGVWAKALEVAAGLGR
jgi:hypothetical protein